MPREVKKIAAIAKFSFNKSAGFRLMFDRWQIKSCQLLVPLIKEGNMTVDDLIALGVILFVLAIIGLICFLGLSGFFSAV
jgi:hypothetical protein